VILLARTVAAVQDPARRAGKSSDLIARNRFANRIEFAIYVISRYLRQPSWSGDFGVRWDWPDFRLPRSSRSDCCSVFWAAVTAVTSPDDQEVRCPRNTMDRGRA
jgi:hypothetical protein